MRLIIADTDEDRPIFYDEELAAFLAMEGTVKLAGARALEALAADKARIAVSVGRGSVSENFTQIARELRESAKQLREEEAAGVFEAVISPSWERFSYERNMLLERENAVRQ